MVLLRVFLRVFLRYCDHLILRVLLRVFCDCFCECFCKCPASCSGSCSGSVLRVLLRVSCDCECPENLFTYYESTVYELSTQRIPLRALSSLLPFVRYLTATTSLLLSFTGRRMATGRGENDATFCPLATAVRDGDRADRVRSRRWMPEVSLYLRTLYPGISLP